LLTAGGVWNDGDTSAVLTIAALANFYHRPIYEMVDYIRSVRKKYGDKAVELEIDFALGSRRAKSDEIEKMNKPK
jgi:hypothetical protein